MKHILLIGHGSRDEDGVREFHEMTAKVQEKLPHLPITTCFLELAEPCIGDGIDSCAAEGAEEIIAIPVILSKARHFQHDIPEELLEAWEKYPNITIRYGEPLGTHSMLVHAIIDQIRLKEKPSSILLVSQGSSLPEGNESSEKLAADLLQYYPEARIENAYMVMAEPTLKQGLESLAAKEDHILVVPNFLFSGTMYKKIAETIEEFPEKAEIDLASCYGLSENFADLLADRILCHSDILKKEKKAS
ncbi:sirohydrochlorin chelatase [Alkalicoccus daliensis]|uniref:Sirohydrochlorin cobaltochelatase n=1 Tax=Alkalicoccus daliensis TaxID=745820 RepID=A0A1H0FXP3_9BACI|nr:sirohydrochlorin chelatase [Alkalicoccus daliensis]SDN99342.1 sirohydrochlorin cobaltochelatase [Alkalicoccus daliensis]